MLQRTATTGARPGTAALRASHCQWLTFTFNFWQEPCNSFKIHRGATRCSPEHNDIVIGGRKWWWQKKGAMRARTEGGEAGAGGWRARRGPNKIM